MPGHKTSFANVLSARAMAAAAALAVVAAPALAQSDAWNPSRNVEIVVGVGPGGGIDRTARLVQRILQDRKLLDVTASVVNKPGGGGRIAQAYLDQHAGDAHYLQITATSLLTNHILGKSKHGYGEVTPVAMLYDEYIGFAVTADSPIASGKDLVQALRDRASELPIGIATSAGNTNHIAAGLVAKAAGIDVRTLKVVVFNSGGESMRQLLGGHVALVITPSANLIGHIQQGRMRGLAIAAPARLEGPLASVPTWKEQGVGAVVANWRPIVGPKEFSRAQVAYWEGVILKVTDTPEWKAELARTGGVSHYLASDALKRFFESQYADFKAVLTDLGLAR